MPQAEPSIEPAPRDPDVAVDSDPGSEGGVLQRGSLAEPLWATIRKPRPPWSVEAFGAVVVLLLVVWALSEVLLQVRTLLWWGVVAAFMYFALAPAVDWLARHRWPRGLAALVVLLGVIGLALGLLAALTPLAVAEAQKAIVEAPTLLSRARDLLGQFGVHLDPATNASSLQSLLARFQSALPSVAGGAVSVTSAVIGALFEGFVILLFTFFLLADQDRVRHGLLSLFRPNTQVIVGAAWNEAVRKTGGYLYSRLLTSFLAGTFVGIALVVLGCPYPVALAVWYGLVSQFVPMIGTYVAAALPLLILLLNRPWDAVWFLLVLAAWIPLQDYVIGPRLSAKTMALSPAAAVIALMVGVDVFGPLGAFLALPAAAVIQSVGSTFFARHEVVPEAAYRPQ